MLEFRYKDKNNWYRGNTHLHSVKSDGSKNFDELAVLYKEKGYDFLFRTDHWVCSDVEADKADYPLLWLDGIELDGTDSSGGTYHVVCLGKIENLSKNMDFSRALEFARAQGGLLILAHPRWMGNSEEEALRYNFDGVEVYNHTCRELNGKGEAGTFWDLMRKVSPHVLGFSVDDAHFKPGHPGYAGGWIMVNADSLERQAIMDSIRTGNFYSSRGPAIHSLKALGNRVTIETSPVKEIRLIGPGPRGINTGMGVEKTENDKELIIQADFTVPEDWPYAYFEIEDSQGYTAWTNSLFI
jgi:hypothetical protein